MPTRPRTHAEHAAKRRRQQARRVFLDAYDRQTDVPAAIVFDRCFTAAEFRAQHLGKTDAQLDAEIRDLSSEFWADVERMMAELRDEVLEVKP